MYEVYYAIVLSICAIYGVILGVRDIENVEEGHKPYSGVYDFLTREMFNEDTP
tara:strand:+ start:17210 stop:17368 length:159 start_codon:yes stop_codon:yes gene_type:complete